MPTDGPTSRLAELGGSALSRWCQEQGLSWVHPSHPEREVDGPQAWLAEHYAGEHTTAAFTTYAPPHALALTDEEGDAILDALGGEVQPSDRRFRADSSGTATT